MSSGHDSAGVQLGEVLAGKYRVERVLGAGGMGVVVAAHHIQLDEKVALKFLLPEALRNPEAVARFLREARNAVKIKSEHVARVKDVGQLETGAPYMVMEYLDGDDLSGWITQRGALPIEQAVEFVLQACVALAEAHGLGIVHRDLKPANLFCIRGADGQLSIKVLDFGISKVKNLGSSGPGADLTRADALMGTPLYMSPEQMRSSKDVDARTDIWALGVILFELIAGKPPFSAEGVAELVLKVASDPPPSLRTFLPGAPEGLDAVIRKCLEKQPSQRYRNVGDLALALLPFAPKRSKSSVERISGIVQASGMSAGALEVSSSSPVKGTRAVDGTFPSFGRTTNGAKAGKSVALGIGLLGAVALVAGIAFVAVRWSGPTPPPPRRDEPKASAAVSQIPASPEPEPTADPPKPVGANSADKIAAPPVPAPSSAAPHPGAEKERPGKGEVPTPKASAAPAAATSTASPAAPPPAPTPAKPNCDPPYYYDARHVRIFKPECT